MESRRNRAWDETPKPDLSRRAQRAIIAWGLREFKEQPADSEHAVATYTENGLPKAIVVLRDLRQEKKKK